MKKLLLLLIAISFSSKADIILYRDGKVSQTQIVDTTGCNVKIIRKEYKVSVKKDLIDKIIWKNDTVSYSDFSCTQQNVNVIKYNDQPEIKLLRITGNAPEFPQEFKTGSKVAYLCSPLQSNCSSFEFVGLQNGPLEIIRSVAHVDLVNADNLVSEMLSEESNYDYTCIFKQYEVAEFNKKNTLSGFMTGSGFNQEIKKDLYTTCDFIIFDIRRKEIIFRKVLTEKRHIWSDREGTVSEIITPDKWEEHWLKENSQNALEKSTLTIRRKLQKELTNYFQIDK